MPIDDALEGISGAVPPGQKPAEGATPIDMDVVGVFTKYPSTLVQACQTHCWPIFVPEYPALFHKWMRFDRELAVKFKEVPRDNVIAIITAIDEKQKYLLQETDLKDYLSDPFLVDRLEFYLTVPPFLNLQQILGFSNIQGFLERTQLFFTIPNLTFASLFIEEGEKLRQYAQSTDKDNAFSLKLFRDSPLQYQVADPFTIEALTRFSEKTGIKELKAMVEQVLGLASEIENYRELPSAASAASDLRGKLYRRLQKYHPELTIGG